MMIGHLLSEGVLSSLAETFMQQIVYTTNPVMYTFAPSMKFAGSIDWHQRVRESWAAN